MAPLSKYQNTLLVVLLLALVLFIAYRYWMQ
jgi:hypothetical protein